MCSKLHNVTETPHAGSAEYNNNDDHREKLYSVNFIVEQRKKARITRYSYTMNTRRARKKTSRQPTSYGRQTNRLGAVATLAIFGGKRRRQPPTGNWQRVRVPSALKFTSCFMATHGQEKSGHAQQHTHIHTLTHTLAHAAEYTSSWDSAFAFILLRKSFLVPFVFIFLFFLKLLITGGCKILLGLSGGYEQRLLILINC